uniref:Chemosensory protein 01 n=1 Tax=Chrysomela lapponica TaxID=153811 RepID=A0A310SBF6_CHRLA
MTFAVNTGSKMNCFCFSIFSILVISSVIDGDDVDERLVKRIKRTAVDKYSTKYDNFDILSVFVSTGLVERYGDCLMERGSCSPEGKFLKQVIPDAIATKCSKCNAKQKKLAGVMLQQLLLNYRPLFIELCDKYDPTGEARKMYRIDSNSKEADYENYDEA